MRKLSFALGIALVGAAPGWADDGPEKKPPAKDVAPAKDDAKEKDVAEQIQDVQTEFSKKAQGIVARYRAAEDNEERQKILQEYRSLQTEMNSQIAAIVDKNSDNPAIFPALQQLVQVPEQSAKATALLIKHHVSNPQIGTTCLMLGRQGVKDAEPLLRAVAEKSKSDEAKGLALLGLGQLLLSQADNEAADDTRREKLRGEAQEALKKVVRDYPDVKAFQRKAGDWASAVLFEVEHLSVGLPVPDLAGEDLEGQEFKLSDYRGKVVFLDFWAHW
ncbi:MAG TPA: hypothetical protein VHC22_05830 [Pirellulales bacterium]|nr:hypothetical protein [Pirellulales bacterium]